MRKLIPGIASYYEKWLFARGWRRTAIIGITCGAYVGFHVLAFLSGGFEPFFFIVNFFLIVLVAGSLGIWGALVAATASGLLWGPFVSLFVSTNVTSPAVTWVIRLLVFELFGLLAGTLTAVYRHQVRMQRETNEQLLQAQKLESIGLLTGGIAHDFNNMLTAIGGYAELLARDAATNSTLVRLATELQNVVQRSSRLTHQLMAIGGQRGTDSRSVDLTAELGSLGRVLERIIGEKIQLKFSLDPTPVKVEADPVEIDQIIMNLAVNAVDAMPEGGTLQITTQKLTVDAVFAAQHPGLRPGEYAEITVTDTGTGMDDTVSKHLFEPFFTTKQEGKGTGLGLPTVRNIVHQLKGDIWFQTVSGRGTSFTIWLPRAAGKTHRQPQRTRSDVPVPDATAATVLVAEDEETVRTVISRILKLAGYRVILAENGEEALDMMRDPQSRVDLLITDLVLPGKSGIELLEELSGSRPSMKVIVISGYPRQRPVDEEIRARSGRFLAKPFTGEQLLAATRQALG